MNLSIPLRITSAVLATILLLVAALVSQAAFKRVLAFRTLERIPLTQVLGSTGGEVQLRGEAVRRDRILTSPDSKTDTLYYHYLLEEKYKDSEGHTKWRTLRNESNAVDFYLRDASGRALVSTQDSLSRIDWSIQRKHRQERNGYRYSEWRIDPGDTVSLFGWMELSSIGPVVNFREQGQYLPIISSFDADKERGDIGWIAVLLLGLAISALSFMSFFLVCSLAIHRVLVLLTFITLSTGLMLLHYGWRSLENDVGAGYQRVETQLQRAEELLAKRFQTLGLDVASVNNFDLRARQFQNLSDEDKAQLNGWRMGAVLVRDRYLQQISRFPENLFAWFKGLNKPKGFQLPEDQQAIADAALQDYHATRIGRQIILTLLGFGVMAALAWLAFIFIRLKRIQENLPTTKTSGVVYGLTEVVGKLVPENDADLLVGPLSSEHCTWYNYLVKERRGSGKRTHWVTIEKDLQKQPFYCEDEFGRLRVFPNKAEVITRHKTTQRRGKRYYYEWRLMPGDELYLLGKADIDKTRGDSLVMREARDNPFIISNRSEKEVMLSKAAKGMALLSLSVCLMFFSMLLIAASSGDFSSLDYILTAMAAPMFFIVLMTIIAYNDIVFLKTRCERAWANVQVSLKKRHDLLPRLTVVLKQLMSHEKELQTQLSKLRTLREGKLSAELVQQYVQEEHAFLDQLQVTIERYPNLKTDESLQMLHKSLIKLENEIAMIRAGLNDAVEYYNTRILQFPDVLLAKLGRFKRLSLLAFESGVHALPRY
jgi:hypothetical protein